MWRESGAYIDCCSMETYNLYCYSQVVKWEKSHAIGSNQEELSLSVKDSAPSRNFFHHHMMLVRTLPQPALRSVTLPPDRLPWPHKMYLKLMCLSNSSSNDLPMWGCTSPRWAKSAKIRSLFLFSRLIQSNRPVATTMAASKKDRMIA